MKKFLIIEGHTLAKLGLRRVINELYPEASVLEADSENSAIDYLHSQNFDLCILEASMPGIEIKRFLPRILDLHPNLKVIVSISGNPNFYEVFAFKYGAKGVINKTTDLEQTKMAINKVLNNEVFANASFIEFLLKNQNQNPYEILNEKELRIANMLKDNIEIKRIGIATGLKQNTISTYKQRIFQKLGIQSVFQLIELLQQYSPN